MREAKREREGGEMYTLIWVYLFLEEGIMVHVVSRRDQIASLRLDESVSEAILANSDVV